MILYCRIWVRILVWPFSLLPFFFSLLTTFEIIGRAKWTWADIGPQGVLERAGVGRRHPIETDRDKREREREREREIGERNIRAKRASISLYRSRSVEYDDEQDTIRMAGGYLDAAPDSGVTFSSSRLTLSSAWTFAGDVDQTYRPKYGYTFRYTCRGFFERREAFEGKNPKTYIAAQIFVPFNLKRCSPVSYISNFTFHSSRSRISTRYSRVVRFTSHILYPYSIFRAFYFIFRTSRSMSVTRDQNFASLTSFFPIGL